MEDMLALIPEEYDVREREGSYNFASVSSLGETTAEKNVIKKYLGGESPPNH